MLRRAFAVSRVCGLLLVALALLVLLGWAGNLPQLTTWEAGATGMKPLTALSFVALGVALYLEPSLQRVWSAWLGAAVMAVASALIADALLIGDDGPVSFLHPAPTTPTASLLLWIGAGAFVVERHSPAVTRVAAVLLALNNLTALAAFYWTALPAPQSAPAAAAGWILAVGLLFRGAAARRPIPLKLALTTLVLVAMLPALLLIEAQIRRIAGERRAEIARRAIVGARQIEEVINDLIAERTATLRVLGSSPHLKEGNLERFHAHASSVASLPESSIILFDRQLNPLLSTARPYGSLQPPIVERASAERALSSGRVELSDVFEGPHSGNRLVSVVLPTQDGRHLLRMTTTGQSLSERLVAAAEPPWTLTILDRNGVVAARSRQAQKFVGTTVSAEQLALLRKQESGQLLGKRHDGRSGHAHFRRHASGWTVIAFIAEEDIVSLVVGGQAFGMLGWLGIALLGVLLSLATAVAFARPLRQISHAAGELGRGLVPAAPRSAIAEFDQLGLALESAGRARHAREEALRERSHLETLGRLTSGVAHDFNNLLTIVSGNLQLLEPRVHDDAARQFIDEAARAIEAGSRLNQRLMSYAQQRRLEPAVVDLNGLVRTALALLRRTVGESIEIDTRLCSEPALVRADPSELENALVNLALNARDAMPSGGRLFIETDIRQPRGGGQPAGDRVRLTIRDTGCGMSPEVAARAFEPFFTTKSIGHGTGLGLTTIRAFVRESNGSIALSSEADRGTTLIIELPRLEQGEPAARPHVDAGGPADGARGEIVLLVEDNDGVRRVTRGLLETLGYAVIEAPTGAAALSLLHARRNIDVLLSDIAMPGGVSGWELAAEVARMSKPPRVLLFSGVPEIGQGHGQQAVVLRKPFSRAELAAALQRLRRPERGTEVSVGVPG